MTTTVKLPLGSDHVRLEVITAGAVTYLALLNYDVRLGIPLTPDEAVVAQALFVSIGTREPVVLPDGDLG